MPRKNTKRPKPSRVPPLGPAPDLRITVTEEDYNQGMPKSSSHCMVAEAIKRTYPWATYISLDLGSIRLSDRDNKARYTYLCPNAVAQALLDFDEGLQFKGPFSFRLRSGWSTRMDGYTVAGDPIHAKLVRRKKIGPRQRPNIVGGKEPPNYRKEARFRVGAVRQFGVRMMGR